MYYCIYVHYVQGSIPRWCLLYRKTGCNILFMYTMSRGAYPAGACCTGRQDVILYLCTLLTQYRGAYPAGACCTGRKDVRLHLCTLCTGEHILLVLVVQEDKM